MFKRKTVITIFLLLYFVNMFPQKHINGLLFSSSAERKNNRTSMVLFEDSPLNLQDAFSIAFDFSIWDIEQFGYIFRVINEKKQEISFAFVNFYGEDKIYLDFHSQITHKSVQVPITAQDIAEKRWLSVNFMFDLKADRVEIVMKDSIYVCESVGLKNPSRIKLAFGLYGYNLEVPEAAVRNICIQTGKKETCSIPLSETAGEKVHDTEKQVVGYVENPKWMINRHFYWQEKTAFNAHPAAGISYDAKRNNVLVVDEDSVLAYSMRYHEKTAIPLNKFPFTRHSGTIVYDDENDKLYIYNLKQETPEDPTLAIMNMQDSSVEYKYAPAPQLNHHNVLLKITALYIFGGYEEHSYSNKLLQYNLDTDRWDTLAFSGDEIYPRYFSALGQGLQPSQLLVMGGIGNESGKREHGVKHLYDLFSMDMDTKQIKKLWDIKDKIQSDVTPCSNIVLSEDKTCFYTLCYPQYQENSVLQLYRFNISDGNYDMVGDSIYINTEQIETSVYLFYNELMKEFYAVIRENAVDEKARIRIYSLSSPPIVSSELNFGNKYSSFWLLLLLPVVVIIALIIAWYLKKKRKNVSDEDALPENAPDSMETLHTARDEHRKNSVFVFGEFTVYDKNGKDISYGFSTKLKELFAYLLLHSSADTNGISTNMMTSELWPNKDMHSAKNTRGVTINRLRNILKDVTGITLFCQDSKWYFSFDSIFYCDYLEYREKIDSLNENSAGADKNMPVLYDILKRGTLFPNVQENWIDAHKQKYEAEIWKILWNYMLKLYEAGEYTRLIEYSDLCFIIDPLDEDVFKLCMHVLQKTGKRPQSIMLYNRFVSNYKDLMGINPDLSIINSYDFSFSFEEIKHRRKK